ncbi:hypothetical protein Tco_1390486, partial [Tanacetum coccineum]
MGDVPKPLACFTPLLRRLLMQRISLPSISRGKYFSFCVGYDAISVASSAQMDPQPSTRSGCHTLLIVLLKPILSFADNMCSYISVQTFQVDLEQHEGRPNLNCKSGSTTLKPNMLQMSFKQQEEKIQAWGTDGKRKSEIERKRIK